MSDNLSLFRTKLYHANMLIMAQVRHIVSLVSKYSTAGVLGDLTSAGCAVGAAFPVFGSAADVADAADAAAVPVAVALGSAGPE